MDQAAFDKAVQYKLDGQYDEALAILRPMVATQPNNAELFHELGLIHSFKVDLDESIYYLESAVRLAPTNTGYMIDAGKNHAMFGNDDKAKAIFEYVLRLDPNNKEATDNLAFFR